jgi:hypothetical protein
VLGQCTALTHLDLSRNRIGDAGAQRLKEWWSGPEGRLYLVYRYSLPISAWNRALVRAFRSTWKLSHSTPSSATSITVVPILPAPPTPFPAVSSKSPCLYTLLYVARLVTCQDPESRVANVVGELDDDRGNEVW